MYSTVVALIVAHAANRTIGRDGTMPWHIAKDLRYFRDLTLHHPVIMGRKTYESLGRPVLPHRLNIVVSQSLPTSISDMVPTDLSTPFVAPNLPEALWFAERYIKQRCQTSPKIFIAGGATLYQEGLSFANRIYATEIAEAFEGDTFFPIISMAQWQEVSRYRYDDYGMGRRLEYAYVEYRRVSPVPASFRKVSAV